MDVFIQQVINGLTLGAVYAMVALGYTMVYGIIQLINFAHGEVVMVGAMVAFSVIGALAPSGLPPLAIVLVAAGCAIPVCMLIGYAMERAAYRPLRGAPRLAPLITAIGVSIILQHLAMLIWSRNPLAFPQIIKVESYHFAGATITSVQIAILRSEEHTSELQSRLHLVCRLLLEKKKTHEAAETHLTLDHRVYGHVRQTHEP